MTGNRSEMVERAQGRVRALFSLLGQNRFQPYADRYGAWGLCDLLNDIAALAAIPSAGGVEEENRELRKIIAELGYCTPDASLEFMRLIPGEIRGAAERGQ